MKPIKHALRAMLQSPGFTAVAVLILALGIGANTAVFSLFKTVVLEPFPYPQADQLVHIWETDIGGRWRGPLSAPDFYDFRDQNDTFEDLGVYCPYEFNLGTEVPERVPGALCSAGLLRTLGVPAAMGRFFTEAEEMDGSYPVVLSHALWEGKFEAAPSLVGQSILINGVSHRVVGIMPPSFTFFSPWKPGQQCQLWTPFPLEGGPGQLAPDNRLRPSRWLLAVGRFRPGVGLPAAQADLRTIAARLAEDHPESNARVQVWLMPFSWAIVGESIGRLLILIATVGFMLLVACANLATLLLARGSGRSSEIAVRLALGASRRHILLQLLGESAVLASVGAAVGVLVAYAVLSGLSGLLTIDLPRSQDVVLDQPVLWFALGLAALTVILFGLAPALVAARTNVLPALKQQGGYQVGFRARTRLLKILLTVQMALTLLVTTQAVMLFSNLWQALTSSRAFDTKEVLTASVTLSGGRYLDPNQRVAFWDRLLERVEALPTVERAAVATQLPLKSGGSTPYRLEGEVFHASNARRWALRTYVSAGFFEAMGLDLLTGRGLQSGDERSPIHQVVVNQTLVDRCWPDQDPLGRELIEDAAEPGWTARVVGVVESAQQDGFADQGQPEIYWLYPVNPWEGSSLVVRSTTDPDALMPAIRHVLSELDPYLPLAEVASMQDVVVRSLQGRSFIVLLVALMAAVILSLAMIGAYGMTSYVVAQRTRELGLRMALGASRRRVLANVVGQIMLWATCGLVAGLILAVNAMFLLRHLVYGVGSSQGLSLLVGSVLVLAATLGAVLAPALRATRLDPMKALRCE